jgi:hypothetical protein
MKVDINGDVKYTYKFSGKHCSSVSIYRNGDGATF